MAGSSEQNSQSLVDVGLIEIGLAITAIGFVLSQTPGEQSEPFLGITGRVVYYLGAFSSSTLYGLYLADWVAKNLMTTGERSPSAWPSFVGHVTLFVTLFVLLVAVGHAALD